MIRLFKLLTLFLCCFVFLRPAAVFAQDTTKILLEKGDRWDFNKEIRPDAQRIIGNVILRHDSALMYCDSAYLNEASNTVYAYHNVHIHLSDTLNLFGDSLTYNGNTKQARVWSNVKLIDNETTLTTDTLIYDRNTQIATYNYWGKIVNEKNILISKHGYYYTDKKEFFFKDKVLLLNPDYTMKSDTLMYNTATSVAYFFGPSQIVSKDKVDSIYTENGWYNTKIDIASFKERAKIFHESQYLTGDSMYYERKPGFGQVFRHAVIFDSIQNMMLTGNYGEMHRDRGFAFMTDSAVAIMVDKKTALHIHGDSVKAWFDSSNNIRSVYAYYKVKFFRPDLQGMCDSLVWHSKDSAMVMYHEPVIWSVKNQMTADSIRLVMKNGVMDTMALYNSAFLISQDDTGKYNQIKGRDMAGYFKKNELYKIKVLGNAETVYWGREEDKTLIGIQKAVSSDMLVFISNNQLKSITYLGSTTGAIYPEKDVSPYDLKLKNFKWLEDRRPKTRQDIFVW
ncbi:MAG: OstA-like protein [Bacteroidales bacterium]